MDSGRVGEQTTVNEEFDGLEWVTYQLGSFINGSDIGLIALGITVLLILQTLTGRILAQDCVLVD